MAASLKFETCSAREWVAWCRRGAYLLTHLPDGRYAVSFMPRMSAKNPKPVFARIGESVPTQRDGLVLAQEHSRRNLVAARTPLK